MKQIIERAHYEWSDSKLFKESFINIGWNLNTRYNFPKCEYISADTETELFYLNEKISDDKAYELLLKNGYEWIRKNIEVRPYAFTLSDGENFTLFQNIEDFLTCLALMKVKICCWYNARFDFAIFDYYLLTNKWTSYESLPENKRKKPPANTYNNLMGDFGQRYQLTLYIPYLNKSYEQKIHKVKMIDICNISAGGLAKNLKDWDIEDKNGNKIRKLTMEYDNADILTDLPYMIADTKGLHLLALKINKTVCDLTGFSLFKGDYLTAGGLSKKTFLKHLFKGEYKSNIKAFNTIFPITPEEDTYYRNMGLYVGGKCLINPYKISQIQSKVYKYDENSMYPDKMRNMLYPVGNYKIVKNITNKKDKLYILTVKNFLGIVKQDKIPIMPDPITGEYNDIIDIHEPFMIWFDEIEELKKWYNLVYDIDEIREFNGRKIDGFIEFVDIFYNMKCNSTGAVKNVCKLILNSAYGKLAQRIKRISCHNELTDTGYVHIVRGEEELDTRSMLNVMVGSRITALARVDLMKKIREITNENVKENFLYCDTDSVHSLTPYGNTDNKKLGMMKCEGIFENAVYLAPKTYLMYNNIEEGTKEFEVHCKGVNTKVVKEKIDKCVSFARAREIFSSDYTFKSLISLTVKGGRALIYADKVIIKEETKNRDYEEQISLEEKEEY